MKDASDYAAHCVATFAPQFPLLWPRRTAGEQLRVVALVGPTLDAVAAAALEELSRLSAERFDFTLARIGGTVPAANAGARARTPRIVGLSSALDMNDAKRIARFDPDVLVDLIGRAAPVGPLLARRPARRLLTVAGIGDVNVEPLVDRGAVAVDVLGATLDRLQRALAVRNAEQGAMAPKIPEAGAMTALWENAVRAHQGGKLDVAREGYERVLSLQPGYAPAHYLLGIVLRECGDRQGARAQFDAATAGAPGYVDARIAAATTAQAAGDTATAIALCTAGLAVAGNSAPLWRTLGLAQLATGDTLAAATSFERAVALAPDDADTHYNHGVALQMQRHPDAAETAYRRAITLHPKFPAANFNLGVLCQEQGRPDAAAAAYRAVLDADPVHVASYKNLGEVLFAAGRLDAWIENFRRFEAHCPDALPLAVQALEACHHLADFRKLDDYLEGLAEDRFEARDDIELVDSLEQLLYLLLFFDVSPETMLRLARNYNAAARRVYGEPLRARATRNPGRPRIGYLSADLRNHVMGKMMWEALRHHDKAQFELFFYSLATREDEWTERFRGLADRFDVVALLSERAAAERIAADDLDILVDLSTHTKGARPGILALKPARVQLTHIASAGTVGLATIDFKLTDHHADLPANESQQIEKLLPMDGCVYPYRHIRPAVTHPFDRCSLGIARDAVVIGAFVSGLKLSRRCLALWREVLERLPRAILAFSPVMAAQWPLYLRLTAAAGIAADRVVFVPQGRDDAENQARYTLVDFVLDPMPYGGTNGTLEALDMGVPVVTLVGQRHCERTSYSILANLGVEATVAFNAQEYVRIAVRLCEDAAFMHDVRAAIRAGLVRSPLVDAIGHTRALERAYVAALADRAPEVLVAATVG